MGGGLCVCESGKDIGRSWYTFKLQHIEVWSLGRAFSFEVR